MNYFSLIDEIKQVSLRYSEEFYEGDIYEYLNSGNHKYPCIILTVQNITTDEDVNTISATIFAVDRLTNDSSNKLEVQSLCMSKITQILGTLEERVSSIQSNTLTPFTEKFSDLCGGMYGEFTLEYIGDGVCDEGLQYKEIELTNNGIYDIIGYDKAIVNFQLEELNVTSNGEYLPTASVKGFDKVTVEIPKVKVTSLLIDQFRSTEPLDYWDGRLIDVTYLNTFNNFARYSNIKEINIDGWECIYANFNFSTPSKISATNCFYESTVEYIHGHFKMKVSTCGDMFRQAKKLKHVDVTGIDVSETTSVSNIFYNCPELEQLDLTTWILPSNRLISNHCFLCRKLKSIIGGRNINDVLQNDIAALKNNHTAFNFSSTQLDRASLRALINGLADLTGQTAQTLTLGATLIAKLTEEDIAIAVSKNWTIV